MEDYEEARKSYPSIQGPKDYPQSHYYIPLPQVPGSYLGPIDPAKKTVSKDGSTSEYKQPLLFTPIKIGNLELPNRLVASAMAMFTSKDGFMSDFHLAHHGSFALHGAAMCFIEATAVEARGRTSLMDNGIWSDNHIPGIKKTADLVHLLGGRIGIQLAHGGRKSSAPSRYTEDPPEEMWLDEVVGPSRLKYNDEHHHLPREMTIAQIKSSIASFAAATVRAAKAGVDLVEIHGAHGYLIHNFLSFVSNHRTDEYGGPLLENRARFLLEVIRVVRANFPAEKPVSLRISCTDWIEYKGEPSWDIEQSVELAKMIRGAGVDMLDCSTGGNDPDQKIPIFPGYQVQFAAEIKKRVPGLLISTVGIINTGQLAEDILQEGRADIIKVGRGFLKHPNLPEVFARELNAKIAYQPTYSAGRHA